MTFSVINYIFSSAARDSAVKVLRIQINYYSYSLSSWLSKTIQSSPQKRRCEEKEFGGIFIRIKISDGRLCRFLFLSRLLSPAKHSRRTKENIIINIQRAHNTPIASPVRISKCPISDYIDAPRESLSLFQLRATTTHNGSAGHCLF